MRILITGANGYLGGQLSRYLACAGHSVTALCYPEIPDDKQWCSVVSETIRGDITDKHVLDFLAHCTFDAAIHLVSLDQNRSAVVSPEDALRINVLPCWNLLRILSENGLKKFVFFSTVHVYGKIEEGIITEDHKLNPVNVYALTHVLAENVCDYYNRSSETECITVRLSNSYGPPVFAGNNCWWLVVNDLCRTAYNSKKIILKSDGSAVRDFIFGEDVCRAVGTILEKSHKRKEKNIYHISSSRTYTILELAGYVKKVFLNLFGEDIPVNTSLEENVSDFNRFSNIHRYVIDNKRLTDLGFKPKYDIERGIEAMFDYFSSK